jgi:uncharacterized membrane protein
MASTEDFLTAEEKRRIVAAIEDAEKRTTGEIRVHLENWCWADAYKRATDLFTQLGMNKTAQGTGVLIYIAVKSHKMAIVGDAGINVKVPSDFWKSTLDHALACFRENRYADGIVETVNQCAAPLELHFPKTENNPDELSNEISFGS